MLPMTKTGKHLSMVMVRGMEGKAAVGSYDRAVVVDSCLMPPVLGWGCQCIAYHRSKGCVDAVHATVKS